MERNKFNFLRDNFILFLVQHDALFAFNEGLRLYKVQKPCTLDEHMEYYFDKGADLYNAISGAFTWASDDKSGIDWSALSKLWHEQHRKLQFGERFLNLQEGDITSFINTEEML